MHGYGMMDNRSDVDFSGLVEGEVRALREARERLGAEVERLGFELAQAREMSQTQAVAQAAELGAVRGRAEEAHAQAERLRVELAQTQRRKSDEAQARLHAELDQLKAQMHHLDVEQVRAAAAIEMLRRDHTAALASLPRPEPIDTLPKGLTPQETADYLVLTRSSLMDPRWYLARHPDVADAGVDPALHYLQNGWREGRQPGPAFDGQNYLRANPDVAEAGINPLVHYQLNGALELRTQTHHPKPNAETVANSLEKVENNTCRIPQFWFFAGDTIEWINEHSHLTGVGRVTSELLFSAITSSKADFKLCLVSKYREGLTSLEDWQEIKSLAQRICWSFSDDQIERLNISYRAPVRPIFRGDHILFTGVVWTDQYIKLFQHLDVEGISFSVLVHDIIPLQNSSTERDIQTDVFAKWLSVVLKSALIVFVSNKSVAVDLAKWSVTHRILPKAQICPITFGSRLRKFSPAEGLDLTKEVNTSSYVLCVGTIDDRKNQEFLLRVWREILVLLGDQICPQLVLVGRDDIALLSNPIYSFLRQRGRAVVLHDISDGALSKLYENCLFTAFPSKSEGYGLPVAESLAHHKLCLASDLPSVRSHAGDLVWYFSPLDLGDAVQVFKRALTSPSEVSVAVARIQQNVQPRGWDETFSDINEAIASTLMHNPVITKNRDASEYFGLDQSLIDFSSGQTTKWNDSVSPEVSIIIVNWNAASLTRDCIRQVWAVTSGVRYEIIVIDNGSRTEEKLLLDQLGIGVRFIDIGCNRFFGEANNIAVEAARGKYICLLNNDAFVEHGWLVELVKCFKSYPMTGAAGPLFKYPDGRIQEAGGGVDSNGYPIRAGRGEFLAENSSFQGRTVDYISAATLLIDRDLYIAIGGFDLSFEPAYYEDTDICFKIKAAGYDVVFCPRAVVIHIEGAAANGNSEAEMLRKHLGDLNRAKFVARWGTYLQGRTIESLESVKKQLNLPRSPNKAIISKEKRPSAIIYTGEPLTPGGGERYLLTCAEALLRTHKVTLVTPFPYSHLRILDVGESLGLDLHTLQRSLIQDIDWNDTEVQLVMGNHIIPQIPARARINLFHCQFPFPLARGITDDERKQFSGYESIIVNSKFTALHTHAAINAHQLPEVPVTVIAPPVPPYFAKEKNSQALRILSVGRFFRGGHSKRQDVLIKAFKTLTNGPAVNAELHLAGSSHPSNENVSYLAELIESAAGYPIYFHINCSKDTLSNLYASALVYWHASGIEQDLVSQPWASEHFGISIVEAMSAGAVPFALGSGGAREIITHGKDGFFYHSEAHLVEQTQAFLRMPLIQQQPISDKARTRSQDYQPNTFQEKILRCIADMISQRLEYSR